MLISWPWHHSRKHKCDRSSSHRRSVEAMTLPKLPSLMLGVGLWWRAACSRKTIESKKWGLMSHFRVFYRAGTHMYLFLALGTLRRWGAPRLDGQNTLTLRALNPKLFYTTWWRGKALRRLLPYQLIYEMQTNSCTIPRGRPKPNICLCIWTISIYGFPRPVALTILGWSGLIELGRAARTYKGRLQKEHHLILGHGAIKATVKIT